MQNSFRLFACLGLSAGLGISILAAPSKGEPRHDHMGGPRMRGMERIAQELGLSNAQKAKIKAAMEGQRPQMKAIFENKALTQDQKMSKMKALRAFNMKKMDAILTPAQRQKLAQMRKKRRENRRERFGNPADGLDSRA